MCEREQKKKNKSVLQIIINKLMLFSLEDTLEFLNLILEFSFLIYFVLERFIAFDKMRGK